MWRVVVVLFLPLVAFSALSLSCILIVLAMIGQGNFLFWSFLFGVLCASHRFMNVSFCSLGKFVSWFCWIFDICHWLWIYVCNLKVWFFHGVPHLLYVSPPSPLCVCVCMCAPTHTCAYAYVHACTCRPEANFGCHYSGITPFILWERDCLGFTDYACRPAGSRDLPVSASPVTSMNHHAQLFYVASRNQMQASCLQASCLQAVHVTDWPCPCSPPFYLIMSISWVSFLLLLIPPIVFLISLNCFMMFSMSRWVSWRSSFWILLRHWVDFCAFWGFYWRAVFLWMHR